MNKYQKHLKSQKWREIRQVKLQSVNYKCEWCGEKDSLQVHHKHYDTLGDEGTKDLLALCQSCHWAADNVRTGKTSIKKSLLKPRRKTKQEKEKDDKLHPRYGKSGFKKRRKRR